MTTKIKTTVDRADAYSKLADDPGRLRYHHDDAVPDDDGDVQAVLDRDGARGEGAQAGVGAGPEQGHGRPAPPDHRGLHHAQPKKRRLLSHCDHQEVRAFLYYLGFNH